MQYDTTIRQYIINLILPRVESPKFSPVKILYRTVSLLP